MAMSVKRWNILIGWSNTKLTDDEQRAKDDCIGTLG